MPASVEQYLGAKSKLSMSSLGWGEKQIPRTPPLRAKSWDHATSAYFWMVGALLAWCYVTIRLVEEAYAGGITKYAPVFPDVNGKTEAACRS